jgi:hypothetical protein
MRSALAALLAAATAALLAPARPAADEPKVIELKVGEQVALGGSNPICDDPKVAWISADGAGVLHGVKAGTTLCSIGMRAGLGTRQVYRVIVIAPAPPKDREQRAPAKTSEER